MFLSDRSRLLDANQTEKHNPVKMWCEFVSKCAHAEIILRCTLIPKGPVWLIQAYLLEDPPEPEPEPEPESEPESAIKCVACDEELSDIDGIDCPQGCPICAFDDPVCHDCMCIHMDYHCSISPFVSGCPRCSRSRTCVLE